ncbi:MAG: peptidase S8 and S53 subtilisin kexin sedolisin, partial [bacterium]
GYIDDIRGWDFVSGDNNPIDDHGHGSHCAGIASAIGNNSKGIIGVAPNAKILPLKTLSAGGGGYLSDVVDAIYYAADNGAKVISLSLGIDLSGLSQQDANSITQLFNDAINYALSKGCFSVVAAGNSNIDANLFAPANATNAITVGAVNNLDQKASFSNWGTAVEVSAHGTEILSLRANGTNFYNIFCTSSSSGGMTGGTRMQNTLEQMVQVKQLHLFLA